MEAEKILVSSRSTDDLETRLRPWLAARLEGARVAHVERPAKSGMSSETLLVDVEARDVLRRLVIRVEPDPADVPVFPTYDLSLQYRVMRLVAERSDTPVPVCRWFEPDASVLGAPFLVMDRVEGRVPPDNLPYTFESWLLDAGEGDRRALQDDTVWALAGIHGVDLRDLDTSFLEFETSGDSSLRRHVEHWRRYYDWVRGDRRVPLLEQGFAWLDDHWPTDDGGRTVLSWGDSRIGNVLYDGFRPAAVLDWEMAGLGPAGIDLGWMAYMHSFFQDIAEQLGLPGLPGFLRIEDLAETYAARTGVVVDRLDFWEVYAALRYGIVAQRVHDRQVHFGEAEPLDDPDGGVMHREWLSRLIS